jgi:hypothetical protein
MHSKSFDKIMGGHGAPSLSAWVNPARIGWFIRFNARAFHSQPQLQTPIQHVGERLLNHAADGVGMVSSAEMSSDNEPVLKLIPAVDEIVQMDVTEFVDFFLAVLWGNKRHFAN